MSKEKVAKGKTQIPAPKPQWVPVKENPSGIGSSKAFAAPTEKTDVMLDVLPLHLRLQHKLSHLHACLRRSLTAHCLPDLCWS